MAYTKLFSSITTSTIWREDDHTRLVWITMLAMADKHGIVIASLPGLAVMANVSVEGTIAAIEKLLTPDKWSSTQEYEGRRIEKIDRGWRLLNYLKFRDMRDEAERQEYMRNLMRERRAKEKAAKAVSQPVSQPVSEVINVSAGKPGLANASASASASAGSSKPIAPEGAKATRLPEDFAVNEEMRHWATNEHLPSPDDHIAAFRDYWKGVPGARGKKLDWPATFRNWLRRVIEYRGGTNGGPSKAQQRTERNRGAILNALREHVGCGDGTVESKRTG